VQVARPTTDPTHSKPANVWGTRHSAERVWQTRYYDFNVCTAHKRVEKLRYIHRNPVKRGLVEAPELWRWSSFRAYAYQEKGPIRLNEWSGHKLKFREVTTFPQ